MIRKIKTEELIVGMYIHDFNCSWMNHPFFTKSLKISNVTMLQKVIDAGIRELYIDTEQGLDVANTRAQKSRRTSKTSFRPVKKKGKAISVSAEITRAIAIKKQAKHAVIGMMNNIKFGEKINIDETDNFLDNIISSTFRNQDALVSLLRIKEANEYEYMHSVSSCVLMISFCKYLGVEKELIRDVAIGGLLHDIGKMKISDTIINKPGRLSDTEYDLMKKHVEHGLTIIEQIPGVSQIVRDITSQHHERLDGTGYPNGLKGDENSKFGQMAKIVDIYDAMTSETCYRSRLQPTVALSKLYEWSKFGFDHELVQKFIHCVGIYPVGTLVRLDSGYLAIVINRGHKDMLHPVIRVMYNLKKEHYIPTYDIDLSKRSGKSDNFKIVSYESPEKWKINTASFL